MRQTGVRMLEFDGWWAVLNPRGIWMNVLLHWGIKTFSRRPRPFGKLVKTEANRADSFIWGLKQLQEQQKHKANVPVRRVLRSGKTAVWQDLEVWRRCTSRTGRTEGATYTKSPQTCGASRMTDKPFSGGLWLSDNVPRRSEAFWETETSHFTPVFSVFIRCWSTET